MKKVDVSDQLLYCQRNELITRRQHGFLSKHSTCSQLLEFQDDWSLSSMNKCNVDIAYLNFAKAFNTISHPKLLLQLAEYDIKGHLRDWIKAFLSNHSQRVKIDNCFSASMPIENRSPTG